MSMLLILSALVLCGFSAVNGQALACSNGQIRLTPTPTLNRSNTGRVEICISGVWGTIAVDSIGAPWSEKNAQVACIELGFSGALNSIFQRTIPFSDRPSTSTPINIASVACDGTETSLINCAHSTIIPQDVDHLYDAYVVCRPNVGSSYSNIHSGGLQSGDIRLFGDTRNGYGAVSIYSRNLGWLSICPDASWSNSDATRFCQELGYQGGSVSPPISPLNGPGGSLPPRQLYAANCPASSGGDLTIRFCSFRLQRSASSCTSPEGTLAAVACSSAREESVRLTGGSGREGIVEVVYDGRWGTVCSTGFSTPEARAVCRGLGYIVDNTRVRSLSSSLMESASNLKPIWLSGVDCTTNDRNLPACVREDDIIGFADCDGSVAAIDCGDQPLTGGQIAGITVGVLVGVGLMITFFTFLDVKNRQKAARAYNNCTERIKAIKCLSCPSLPRRTRPLSPPTSTYPPSSASTAPSQPPSSTSTPAPAPPPTVAPGPQQPPPEPEPVGQEPEFTKAPPPSYLASPGFPEPSQNVPFDAPPPYTGGQVGFVYAPPSAPGAAAYPPPTQGFQPTGTAYPPT